MLAAAERLGLSDLRPIVLSDAGNLIVHLSPYPIVARVAKLFDGDDPKFWRKVWKNEIKVVNHLHQQGIPVVPCSNLVSPGPHPVGETWMTLWEYAEPSEIPQLNSEQATNMVLNLANAMSDFKECLPPLGAWRNVNQAVDRLSFIQDDFRISSLLRAFESIDEKIVNETLYPAHGDAHPRNLLPSAAGWRWIDFEDVSLMPKFWDIASFIGNTALFHGVRHPVVQCVLTERSVSHDKGSFQFALKARVIMSTMTNLSLAVDGHGDLNFALSQLDRVNDFVKALGEYEP